MANYLVEVPVGVDDDRGGTYEEQVGTINGKPYYAHEGWYLLFVDGQWILTNLDTGTDVEGARNLITSSASTPPVGTWPAYPGFGYDDAEVSLLAAPPGKAPRPTGLLHKRVSGADRRLKVFVPSSLITDATQYKLRLRDFEGNIVSTSAATDPDDPIETASLEAIDYFGYASWIATGAGGDGEESDPVGFTFYNASGVLRDFVSSEEQLADYPDALPVPTVHDAGNGNIKWAFPGASLPAGTINYLYLAEDAAKSANYGLFELVQPFVYSAPFSYYPVDGETHRLSWAAQSVADAGFTFGIASILPALTGPAKPPLPFITTDGADAQVAPLSFNAGWDTVAFQYQRIGYDAIVSEAVTEDEVLEFGPLLLNQPYRGRYVATNADGDTFGDWAPFTPTSGNTGNPGAPGAPGEIRHTHLGATFTRLKMPALPTGADSLRLYRGGALVRSGLSGNAFITITGLVAETDYTFVAQAVNAFGTANGPDLLITTESEDPEPGALDTPDAPVVVKNCALGKIVVTAPQWPAGATSMELRRQVNGGAWSTVHTWSSEGGTYEDTSIAAFNTYAYAVRALATGEESSWSSNAGVTLQSDRLSIAWQLPAASSILSKKQTLRVQLADSGSSSAPLDLAFYVDGLPVAGSPTLISGSGRNGVYEVTLDTRDYSNGSRTLRAQARGSDYCFAKAERAVTLNNTLRTGVGYIEIRRTTPPPLEGYHYDQAAVLLQNEALSPNAARRFWLRTGISATDPGVDWESLVVTAEDKAAAFDALQRVVLRRGQIQPTPELTEYGAAPLLSPGGDAVHWVLQLTPEQVISARTTGCERVAKIERIANGEYLVFADSPVSGENAKLFRFTYDDFVELVDFADHDAGDASDAALLNDKAWCVAPGELFAVDLDSGEATLNLAPRSETRDPLFVVSTGSRILALFVDAGLGSDRTRCYDMTFSTPRLLWALDAATTRARWQNGALLVAAGAALYSTTGDSTPALLETFDADVTAIGGEEATIIGLANGKVHRLDDDTWDLLTTLANDALAVGEWEGSGEELLAVAGTDDTALYEELSTGAWSDVREMAPPAEVEEEVTAITALQRFEKVTRAASGEPGMPEFVPEEKTVALLVGTGDEGLLLMLELAAEPSGAFKTSEPSHLGLSAYQGLVPVEA